MPPRSPELLGLHRLCFLDAPRSDADNGCMSSAGSHRTADREPRLRAPGWLQFRLRTLLLVVALVAALLTAFRIYIEPYQQQRRSMEVVKDLGGSFHTGEAEPWQRRLFGADFQNLTLVN